MMQLHQRLQDIRRETLPVLVLRHRQRAETFRRAIEDLALEVVPFRSSNAMTALSCNDLDAFQVVEELRRRLTSSSLPVAAI